MKRLTFGCPGKRARFDATLTEAASGPGRCVSPGAAGTGRCSRGGVKIGNGMTCSMHRPPARCHGDRAKRRSCCPAHQSPLQSHRAARAMPCLSLVVSSLFACPVTTNEIHDTADLPLDRLTIDLDALSVFACANLRPRAQTTRYPSHSMRRLRSLELAARNVRARGKE